MKPKIGELWVIKKPGFSRTDNIAIIEELTPWLSDSESSIVFTYLEDDMTLRLSLSGFLDVFDPYEE